MFFTLPRHHLNVMSDEHPSQIEDNKENKIRGRHPLKIMETSHSNPTIRDGNDPLCRFHPFNLSLHFLRADSNHFLLRLGQTGLDGKSFIVNENVDEDAVQARGEAKSS